MANSLASRTRDVLLQLKANPHDALEHDIFLPYPLLSKMKQYLASIAAKEKHGKKIFDYEIQNNGVVEILRPVLYKFNSLGISYESNRSLIEESMKYVLDYVVLNYPVHLSWQPVRSGTDYKSEQVKHYDKLLDLTHNRYGSPYSEIKYCYENALLAKMSNRWKLTPLGEFFISLSLPSATVLLLIVESYLSVPEDRNPFSINSWHMSKEFLEKIRNDKGGYVDIGDGNYSLLGLDPNMSYLHRLEELNLTYTIDRTEERRPSEEENGVPIFYLGDDFYEISLTEFGENVINQVLKKDNNTLLALGINLINYDFAGSKFFDFTLNSSIDQLLVLIGVHEKVVQKQTVPLEAICTELKAGKLTIATLRTILPSTERILKNILIESGTLPKGDTKTTLGGIISNFRVLLNSKPILTEETINYVETLERNKVLHGNITPEDQILTAFANIYLNVLLKILQEYQSFIDLH